MPFGTPEGFRPGLHHTGTGQPLCFAFHDGRLVLDADSALPCLELVEPIPLGVLGDRPCLAGRLQTLPEGMKARPLRSLFGRLPDIYLAIAGRAFQLTEFARTHQFCGACGAATRRADDRWARLCTRCDHEAFPRVAPAIIVAVEREDTILLARSPHFPPGIHSVLAGFVDPGESAEEAVHREVREETGIEVEDVRYFGSQPWPFPHSLMLGFQARWAGGDLDLDEDEIVSADFFAADAMPSMFPGMVSISQWLIRDFLQRHR